MASLSLKSIYKKYPGGVTAVSDFNLEIKDKEFIILVGPSGCGKSTTLRAIAGLVKPASGRIHLQAEDITGLSPDKIVSKGITLVPEGRRVFPDLTVLENLKIGAYLRKDNLEDDIKWVYDLFPRLKERSWQAAAAELRENACDSFVATPGRCWPWAGPSCPVPS